MNIPGGGSVTKSCPTLGTSWTVACQAPLSMGFFRQESLECPPGDLPYPGIERTSLVSPGLAGGFFATVSSGKNSLGYRKGEPKWSLESLC